MFRGKNFIGRILLILLSGRTQNLKKLLSLKLSNKVLVKR